MPRQNRDTIKKAASDSGFSLNPASG